MITVCGRRVSDGTVSLPDRAELVVAGRSVVSVRLLDGTPLTRSSDGFRLDGRWQRTVTQTTGSLELRVELEDGQIEPLRVDRHTPLLSADQVALLRQELGELAISFERPALQVGLRLEAAPTATAAQEAGVGAVPRTARGTTGVDHLFACLEAHLPDLLRFPLRARGFEVAAVPLLDAAPSAENLLARRLFGDDHAVLDRAAVETIPRQDYAWILRILQLLEAHASGARRLDRSIADRPAARSGDHWGARLDQLRRWTSHPLFAHLNESPPELPSWALSRSVPGAAILGAWRATGLDSGNGATGLRFVTSRRLITLPVHEDAHLYELWVFLGVVEVLREKFGFRLAAGSKSDLSSYASYDGGGKWQFADVILEWKGIDPFGRRVALKALVQHEPAMAVPGKSPRTPDLALTLRGGRAGEERTTVHILDAKFSVKPPPEQARKVAKARYLEGLAQRPDAAYVVLPSSEAELSRLMEKVPKERWRSMAVRTTPQPVHGFSWGSLWAAPGDESAGLRQFATLALQYHRTELRHVCGNCGNAVDRGSMGYIPTRREADEGIAGMEDGHRDSLVQHGRRAGQLVARGRLLYTCKCGHNWSRQACQEGHLLMKHGRLTPHVRIGGGTDDPDYDVRCGVCARGRGDSRTRRPS